MDKHETMDSFVNTEYYSELTVVTRDLLQTVFRILNEENIKYSIRLIKGQNKIVNIVNGLKSTSNICSIYLQSNHIRIKLSDGIATKILDKTVLYNDYNFRDTLIEKYYHCGRRKRNYSIYLYEDILNNLKRKADITKSSVNTIIDQAISIAFPEDIPIIKDEYGFINKRHKMEFLEIIKDFTYESYRDYGKLASFYIVSFFQDQFIKCFKEKCLYDKKANQLILPALYTNNIALHKYGAPIEVLPLIALFFFTNGSVDIISGDEFAESTAFYFLFCIVNLLHYPSDSEDFEVVQLRYILNEAILISLCGANIICLVNKKDETK